MNTETSQILIDGRLMGGNRALERRSFSAPDPPGDKPRNMHIPFPSDQLKLMTLNSIPRTSSRDAAGNAYLTAIDTEDEQHFISNGLFTKTKKSGKRERKIGTEREIWNPNVQVFQNGSSDKELTGDTPENWQMGNKQRKMKPIGVTKKITFFFMRAGEETLSNRRKFFQSGMSTQTDGSRCTSIHDLQAVDSADLVPKSNGEFLQFDLPGLFGHVFNHVEVVFHNVDAYDDQGTLFTSDHAFTSTCKTQKPVVVIAPTYHTVSYTDSWTLEVDQTLFDVAYTDMERLVEQEEYQYTFLDYFCLPFLRTPLFSCCAGRYFQNKKVASCAYVALQTIHALKFGSGFQSSLWESYQEITVDHVYALLGRYRYVLTYHAKECQSNPSQRIFSAEELTRVEQSLLHTNDVLQPSNKTSGLLPWDLSDSEDGPLPGDWTLTQDKEKDDLDTTEIDPLTEQEMKCLDGKLKDLQILLDNNENYDKPVIRLEDRQAIEYEMTLVRKRILLLKQRVDEKKKNLEAVRHYSKIIQQESIFVPTQGGDQIIPDYSHYQDDKAKRLPRAVDHRRQKIIQFRSKMNHYTISSLVKTIVVSRSSFDGVI